MKTFLHVGCGLSHKANTTEGFNTDDWEEVRLDIDPGVKPDIVGSITSMPVPDASVQAVFSSHNIEHIYAYEVPDALQEFKRVLTPDGFVVIICPDLQTICAMVAEDRLLDTAYVSSMGDITPLDVLYGHRGAIAAGNTYMAHRCGFTRKVLVEVLKSIGFVSIISVRRTHYADLFAIATVNLMQEDELKALAIQHMK